MAKREKGWRSPSLPCPLLRTFETDRNPGSKRNKRSFIQVDLAPSPRSRLNLIDY